MSDNFSLPGVWARVFAPSPLFHAVTIAPRLALALSVASAALLLGLATWGARRLPIDEAWASLWLIGCLASPIAWSHYVWWMLGPLMAVGRARGWLHETALYIGFAVTLLPIPDLARTYPTTIGTLVFGGSTALVALWLLAALMRSASTQAQWSTLDQGRTESRPQPHPGRGGS